MARPEALVRRRVKRYSPAGRREGVPRSAAPRMGRFSDSSSEGLGNNSGVQVVALLPYSSIALIMVQDTDLKTEYLCSLEAWKCGALSETSHK
jgi:hypothetical protein